MVLEWVVGWVCFCIYSFARSMRNNNNIKLNDLLYNTPHVKSIRTINIFAFTDIIPGGPQSVTEFRLKEIRFLG